VPPFGNVSFLAESSASASHLTLRGIHSAVPGTSASGRFLPVDGGLRLIVLVGEVIIDDRPLDVFGVAHPSGYDRASSVMWAMRPSVLMADPVLDGAQVEDAHEPVVSGGQIALEELP